MASADSKTDWLELQSNHVTLKTNLNETDAEEAIVLAEETRAELLAAAWPGVASPPGRIELVAFFDHQDFEAYFGDVARSFLVLDDYPATVYLYGKPGTWEKSFRATSPNSGVSVGADAFTVSVLKQAVAQYLGTFFYPRRPKWFAVGLSKFLETYRLAEEGSTATIGFMNPIASGEFAAIRSLGVSDAFAWGRTFNPSDEGSLRGLSGLSWMLVFWMFNTHLPEFTRYQVLLRSGLDPERAWKAVFPTLENGELDRELAHFSRYGQTSVWSVRLPTISTSVEHARPMTSAEVHATRAQAEFAAGHSKRALSEQAAALRDDPVNVQVLRWQQPQTSPAEALALARRAAAAHPDDGLAWLLLGDALGMGGAPSDERAQAYRKATALSPDHPAAFAALAALELQAGGPQEAVPLATTAVKMAPLDPGYLDGLAAALAAAGQCSVALTTEARAVGRLADSGAFSEARRAELQVRYKARMASIQTTCVEPVTPTPPTPPTPPAPDAHGVLQRQPITAGLPEMRNA